MRQERGVTLYWDGPTHFAGTGAGVYNGEYLKAGFMAQDLKEFEQLYRSQIELGIDHPQIIGMGWCGYYETPSSRSGLVDSRTDEPLSELIEIVSRWNTWMQRQHTERYESLAQES